MTLVDSNVLLDLISGDPRWGTWSAERLQAAAADGPLHVNVIVYAEIAGQFASVAAVDSFLANAGFRMRRLSLDVAFRAGVARRRYRDNGGGKTRMLPDFLIGAHAASEGWALLTRDPRPYRSYFPEVQLITP